MTVYIAIDLGGTQLRVATFSPGSTIPQKILRTPTRSETGSVFDRLTATIDAVWPDEPVSAIYAACPGPCDPERGIIISLPNIPGWVNFPFIALIHEKYKVPTFLDNDANLAAVGEWYYGAGRGYNDLLYLTISTGIGGGVISGGHLITGSKGMAAELGHITVLPGGPKCSCGQPGHLEAIASGTGITKFVTERISSGCISSLSNTEGISAREIATAARNGDPLGLEAFQIAGKYLGIAIADYLHIFNPSILILGGGVSQSGDLLFTPMKNAMREHVMNPAYLTDLRITAASLGDNAGLLGALAQAIIKTKQA